VHAYAWVHRSSSLLRCAVQGSWTDARSPATTAVDRRLPRPRDLPSSSVDRDAHPRSIELPTNSLLPLSDEDEATAGEQLAAVNTLAHRATNPHRHYFALDRAARHGSFISTRRLPRTRARATTCQPARSERRAGRGPSLVRGWQQPKPPSRRGFSSRDRHALPKFQGQRQPPPLAEASLVKQVHSTGRGPTLHIKIRPSVPIVCLFCTNPWQEHYMCTAVLLNLLDK
jgi:hypothetical protein